MAKEKERFVTVFQKSTFGTETRVLVDRITGVNYLFFRISGGSGGSGGGGLTPLLNQDGKPVITAIIEDKNGEN